MDLYVIYCWILGLLMFACVQIFFLRKISRYQALSWQGKVGGGVAGISMFFSAWLIFNQFESIVLAIFGALCVGFFVLLSVVIYLLSIYSYIESSVTLRLFSIIGRSGKRGISYDSVIKKYGVGAIVARRIERFLSMGIVHLDGNSYKLSEKLGAFQLREKLVDVLKVFYD